MISQISVTGNMGDVFWSKAPKGIFFRGQGHVTETYQQLHIYIVHWFPSILESQTSDPLTNSKTLENTVFHFRGDSGGPTFSNHYSM